MEIKTITYYRIKNLGNYQSERMEMVAELTADDDVNQCAADLRDYVEKALFKDEPKPERKINYDNKSPF